MFVAPPVFPADIILHSRDGREQSYRPAIVEQVLGNTLNLRDLVSKADYTGVRHNKDPQLNDDQLELFGCWKEGEAVKRNNEINSRLTKLEEQVAILMGTFSDLVEPKNKDKK